MQGYIKRTYMRWLPAVVVIVLMLTLGLIWNNFKLENILTYETAVNMLTGSDCHLEQNPCTVKSGEQQLRFWIEDRVQYLKPFIAHMDLNGFADQAIERVQITFVMTGMDMGLNRFVLHRVEQQQLWSGRAMLPVCTSGRQDWQVIVEIITKQKRYTAKLPISVTP